jgi:hypothetical protein
VISTAATNLFQRVAEISPSEWLIAAAVASLTVAIAWIGQNVGRLIDENHSLRERLRIAEGNITNVDDFARRIDEAIARRMRALESRQDRLQSKVDNLGKDWRDSMRRTESRTSGEFDLTQIEFHQPE